MKPYALLLVIAACGGRAFQAGTQDVQLPFPESDSGSFDSGFDAEAATADSGDASHPDGQPDGQPDSSSGQADAASEHDACPGPTPDLVCQYLSYVAPTAYCGIRGEASLPPDDATPIVGSTPSECVCDYTCECVLAALGTQIPRTDDGGGYSCSITDAGGIVIFYP